MRTDSGPTCLIVEDRPRATGTAIEAITGPDTVVVALRDVCDDAPVEPYGAGIRVCYVAAEGPPSARAVATLGPRVHGPILTRAAVQAVDLCAQATLYLRRHRKPAVTARVLVVGADQASALTPLLFACGLTDLSLWNLVDRRWLPLRTAVRDVDVVIDLTDGAAVAEVRDDCAEGSLVRPDDERIDRELAPGILAGLSDTGATDDELDQMLLRQCVEVLVRGQDHGCPLADALRTHLQEYVLLTRLDLDRP